MAMPARANIGAGASVVALLAIALGAAPAPAQSPEPLPPALPPLESLSETVERPLFRPDRRPPTIEEIEEEIESAESGIFSLLGIIVSPTERIALVKVRGSQDVLQLSEGQQANGWTVVQIRPGEVVFESNDKTETIELIDISPPPPRRRPAARERQTRPAQARENQPRPAQARDRQSPPQNQTNEQ
jgi:hypothetical protein